MYQFSDDKIREIQKRALLIKYKELRYKKLCEALNIKPETAGNKKKRQLLDLSNIIKLNEEKNGKQVVYIVTDIYETPLLPYYDNDEFYEAIKTRICQMLRNNGYRATWYTRTPLLKGLGAVNNNYVAVMNEVKRKRLEKILNRDMTLDYTMCKIFGNILSDRIYSALNKMTQEQIISCDNGFAICYIDTEGQHHYYPVQLGTIVDGDIKQTSLGTLLQDISTKAIDLAILDNIPDFDLKSKKKVNRVYYRYLYFEDYQRHVVEMMNAEEVRQPIKEAVMDNNFHSVAALYNVKFIYPVKRLVDSELRWAKEARQLINQESKEKLLESKNKALDSYEAIKRGIVDVCIDLYTNIDYDNYEDEEEGE